MITDRDLVLRVIAERKDPRSVRLGDTATTRGLETTSPDTQLCDARALMAERRIRRLPVVKDDRLVGMLSLGDVALGSASIGTSARPRVDLDVDGYTGDELQTRHRHARARQAVPGSFVRRFPPDVGREPVACGPLPSGSSHTSARLPESLEGLRDEP